jgi:hypothetical protein
LASWLLVPSGVVRRKYELSRELVDTRFPESTSGLINEVRSSLQSYAGWQSKQIRPNAALKRREIQHVATRATAAFPATGREFTHGLATLVRTVSDHLEEMAKDANTSTNVGESPDTDGELE